MIKKLPFHAAKLFYRLEKEQWLPADELKKRQWVRFKKIIHHAYHHTEFYKKRFNDAGITPEDIHDIDDVNKIPILTRTELQEPDRLIAEPYQKKTFFHPGHQVLQESEQKHFLIKMHGL